MALLYSGLTPVNPNEARALVLFGRYDGTVRDQGLQWVNPLTERRTISVRVRNFETSKLKVNDHDGNPIEIAAIVVWKVTDTAEALFEVDDFENFVQVQAESALRNLATVHPYDAHIEGDISLRSNPVEIADQLRVQIQDRLERPASQVIEARISHLAYAPEIANAMLRRQQANAVIAARTRIVEGAVGMVEMALEQLSAKNVVQLDEERKAAMVSNLLVVLCSEHEAQPVAQHRDAVRLIGRAHARPQTVPAPPRPGDVRGPPALGRRRPAQRERPGGVPAPARPDRRGPVVKKRCAEGAEESIAVRSSGHLLDPADPVPVQADVFLDPAGRHQDAVGTSPPRSILACQPVLTPLDDPHDDQGEDCRHGDDDLDGG